MEPVIIYGAGGLGDLVQDILQQGSQYRPVAFLDSDPARRGQTHASLPIRGGLEHADALRAEGVRNVIVAVGDNFTRVSLAETLAARGFALASAVHPLASISPSAKLGQHVVIGARATVCVHANICDHAILSAGVIAEHDNVIGKGAFLHAAVRLAGGVTIEEFAMLEIGATVIPGRRVGRAARVRAGAVVIRDVAAGAQELGATASADALAPSRFRPESENAHAT